MVSKKIVLHFPSTLVDEPIVYKIVKDYDLKFNIVKASINPQEQGLIVMELSGKTDNFDKALEYLKSCGVKVEPLSSDVTRNEDKCINCGVCIPVCPVGALEVEPKTRKINFHAKKCIGCELCVPICPVRAMETHF